MICLEKVLDTLEIGGRQSLKGVVILLAILLARFGVCMGVCFRVEWAERAHNVVEGKANLSTFCKEVLNGRGGVYESSSRFCLE
jgi:hypothetical protein